MHRLLNSAMMPDADGSYESRSISKEEFARELRENPFISYIGYPDTAAFIEEIAGVQVPVSREQTVLKDGDVMLVCRLKYRMNNPGDKGKHKPAADDFEFSRVTFKARA